MINEIISTYAQPVFSLLLSIIMGVLGMTIRRLYTRYVDTDTKVTLAKTVVLFVEQVYKDLHGDDKLNSALAIMREHLAEYSIHISDAEMRLLIEAAVAEFNAERLKLIFQRVVHSDAECCLCHNMHLLCLYYNQSGAKCQQI